MAAVEDHVNGDTSQINQPLDSRYIKLLEDFIAERKRGDQLEETLNKIQEKLKKLEQQIGLPYDDDFTFATPLRSSLPISAPDRGTDENVESLRAVDQPKPSAEVLSRVKWLDVHVSRYTGLETEQEVAPWEDQGDKEIESIVDGDGLEDKLAMTWRRVTSSTGQKTQLAINSLELRKALKDTIKGYTSIYHNRDKLQEYKTQIADKDSTTACDIEVMLEQVARQQDTIYKDIEKLTAQGQITHELLWSLFYPGCEVVVRLPLGDYQIAIVAPSSFETKTADPYDPMYAPKPYDAFGNPKAPVNDFLLDLEYIDYKDGQYEVWRLKTALKHFVGTRKITDLDAYPIRFFSDPDFDASSSKVTLSEPSEAANLLRMKLIDRGRKFESICLANTEDSFKQYSGDALVFGSNQADGFTPSKEKIAEEADFMSDSASSVSYAANADESPTKVRSSTKSYIIIDADAYHKYSIQTYNSELRKRDPYYMSRPMTVPNTLHGETISSPCVCSNCATQRKDIIGPLTRFEKLRSKKGKRPELTDQQRLICCPRVFGFMVREKKWAQFRLENIREIDHKARSEAFQQLELDKDTKAMLSNLVQQHSKSYTLINDLIPGKGNGLIVLLHGPPGVGKTLTAESLALQSGKPLYSVTMSDVGTSPESVEENMKRVFELSTRWKALLLFDEADIFLERRSLNDLARNSLVSVLLRILEYFQGILFLTSNRVKTFDEAFQSRIHVAVQFKELGDRQRDKIWKMWFDKYEDDIEDVDGLLEEIRDGDYASARLNGRQIRNVFGSAMALARHERTGAKMSYIHLRRVLKRTAAFEAYMLQNQQMAEKEGIR